MQAANCVLCLSESFLCHEVHEGCLPHNKNDSDKTVNNMQLTLDWIRS